MSGCTRGRGPASWLDSVAPRVSLSSERVVTISWRQDMLLSDPQCRKPWQILVEKEGEEREVCSGTTSARSVEAQSEPGNALHSSLFRENDYFCTLDLSLSQYCGQQFSFSVRVLDQQDTASLWLSTPQRSVLQLQCGGLSSVSLMKSPPEQGTCIGYNPVWRQEPLFYRVDPFNFRSLN